MLGFPVLTEFFQRPTDTTASPSCGPRRPWEDKRAPTQGTARGAPKNRFGKRGASGGPGPEHLSPLRLCALCWAPLRPTHLANSTCHAVQTAPRTQWGPHTSCPTDFAVWPPLPPGMNTDLARFLQISNARQITGRGSSANHRTPDRYWPGSWYWKKKLSPLSTADPSPSRPGLAAPPDRSRGDKASPKIPRSSYEAGPPRLRRPRFMTPGEAAASRPPRRNPTTLAITDRGSGRRGRPLQA